MEPVKKLVVGGGSPPPAKKASSEVYLDCTHPAEDGIMNASNFEQFLQKRMKVNGKAGNLGGDLAVTIERCMSKITLTSDVSFSKRYLKYLTKKYVKKNLRDCVQLLTAKRVANCVHFQINQDEEQD
ncbi:60S ribosomal protein L22-like [Lontra canadensis]|uniref:60S ribosomal protein L22-like n=1 Tax=Lontra canadensis TaxID=76717 RepID=UPI0013F31E46|nr:60S ribosomal protein L22-like [Lontra canadensis]